MSVRNTGPPPRRSQLVAMSPVPDARSSRVFADDGRMRVAKMDFQTRWMPSDIRSFITSYLGATLSNTARTIGFFAAAGTRR